MAFSIENEVLLDCSKKSFARVDNFAIEYFSPTYSTSNKPEYPNPYNSFNYDKLNPLLSHRKEEQEKAVQALYDVYVSNVFKPKKGVLVGTGEITPHNVGLRLAQPYGIPYLPGSGIQGMLRSYILEFVFAKDEENALHDAGFYQIFGGERTVLNSRGEETTEYRKGAVDFMDAYPTALAGTSIKKEVFTNHFPKHYREKEKESPTDTQFPVPILYLITTGVEFQVYAGVRHAAYNAPIAVGEFKGFTPTVVVGRYLSAAFQHFGVGARTKNNLGRGEFTVESYWERQRP